MLRFEDNNDKDTYFLGLRRIIEIFITKKFFFFKFTSLYKIVVGKNGLKRDFIIS